MKDDYPLRTRIILNVVGSVSANTQLAFICLKLNIETLEQDLKYVQS